jgi:hypothetical protein
VGIRPRVPKLIPQQYAVILRLFRGRNARRQSDANGADYAEYGPSQQATSKPQSKSTTTHHLIVGNKLGEDYDRAMPEDHEMLGAWLE